MQKSLQCFTLVFALGAAAAWSADSGESVVVIYNSRVPKSKDVAEDYARRRGVPAQQVLGLELPSTENMSRAQFRSDLEKPLLRWLEDKRLFVFKSEIEPPGAGRPAGAHWKLAEAKVRYAVLCYGVPLRIDRDPALREEGMDKIPEQIRRNEAAVETELALLPLHDYKLPLTGPLRNHVYGATNAALLHPTNGIFLVTRVDGPTPEIARGLVEKAIDAETNGLWGRAYFDLRGVTNGQYKIGEEWLRNAAEVTRHFGFETIVETTPETFSSAFPMSQIAFYAGWYDANASGPFSRSTVEFMPGAFAYHLHSFSAHSIRSTSNYWVGPLLARGVTVTMGAVEEPYLEGTPDIGTFTAHFMSGMSFGEAAYASQGVLSWQITIVGDPLYRPFAIQPMERHQDLEKRGSKWIEWSHLKVVNLSLAKETPVAEVIQFLQEQSATKSSSVLTEKLADLYQAQGKPSSALNAFKLAIERGPSAQQEVRLRLTVAEKLLAAGQQAEALEAYKQFLQKFPDYPDPIGIYRAMLAIAKKIENANEVDQYEREIIRLSPVPKNGAGPAR